MADQEPVHRYPKQFVRVGVAGYKGPVDVTDDDPNANPFVAGTEPKQRKGAAEDKSRDGGKTK